MEQCAAMRNDGKHSNNRFTSKFTLVTFCPLSGEGSIDSEPRHDLKTMKPKSVKRIAFCLIGAQ